MGGACVTPCAPWGDARPSGAYTKQDQAQEFHGGLDHAVNLAEPEDGRGLGDDHPIGQSTTPAAGRGLPAPPCAGTGWLMGRAASLRARRRAMSNHPGHIQSKVRHSSFMEVKSSRNSRDGQPPQYENDLINEHGADGNSGGGTAREAGNRPHQSDAPRPNHHPPKQAERKINMQMAGLMDEQAQPQPQPDHRQYLPHPVQAGPAAGYWPGLAVRSTIRSRQPKRPGPKKSNRADPEYSNAYPRPRYGESVGGI